MAKKGGMPKPEGGRLKQLRQAYTLTRRTDKKLPWVMLGVFLLDVAMVFGLGLVVGHPIFAGIFAVATGVLTVMFVFGSRVQKAAYKNMEGQPGAAAAVLNTIRRGGWTITPAVAGNKNQDMVHRAVGRPGIVLIGEGTSPRGIAELLEAETKRMNRFLADVPVHGLTVGPAAGQVPLPKLSRRMTKLPRTLRGGQVTEVNDRLRAVGDLMKNMPMPKGPLPKNIKMPKGPRAPR